MLEWVLIQSESLSGIDHTQSIYAKTKLISEAHQNPIKYIKFFTLICTFFQKETYCVLRERIMEWFYTKRRGPEWKQGWTSQTLTSISAPPLHLLTIFAIVIVLLWFSQYTGYKAQFQQTTINFQLFLMVLPLLLIFFMASFSSSGWFNFQLRHAEAIHRAGGSPWGVGILLLLILVLLSYQSSFHSRWFGPLSRSD